MDNMDSKEELRKIMKPRLFSGLLFTFTCLGPFGHLIFSIIVNDCSKLLYYALFSFPTLIMIGAYWFWHINKCLNLEKDIEEINDLLE